MLAEVSHTLTGASNLEEALRSSSAVVVRATGIRELAVTLCDAKTEKITLEISCRADESRNRPARSWRKADIRRAMQRRAPLVVNRTTAGVPWLGLLLPLLIADEAVGVLCAELTAAEMPGERAARELLTVVASMVAQAVNTHRQVEAATQRMLDEDANLRDELSQRYDFSRIIGNSGPMRQVYEQIAQVAPTTATVLIQGESGTGKELIAHALHINSPRAHGPFVRVNCGALNEGLIEAELFGHERGAFTDAFACKPGRFELAEGGTIFLDEIGELSLAAQARLLRVLQSREYERIGGSETLIADARVLAATHRNLEKEIALGRFREDLYYRLNVFTIKAPALRERREDIVSLARHFLARHASAHGKVIGAFSSSTLDLLLRYDWPGNVRELENVVERAVVVCDGGLIHPYHLPPMFQTLHAETTLAQAGLSDAVDNYERELVCEALKQTRGNRSQAAKLLKISDRLLGYKIKKHNIVKSDFLR
jgi:Nif-specific regulatory protein